MRLSTLKNKFPNLHNALQFLGLCNHCQLNPQYSFPKEAQDAFAPAEGVLAKLTKEQLDTVIDGERQEAEAILVPFGDDGRTLNGLLAECFDGDYRNCLIV